MTDIESTMPHSHGTGSRRNLLRAWAAASKTVPDEWLRPSKASTDLGTLRAADPVPRGTRNSIAGIALRTRVQSEENIVRWPWEDNELETELESLQWKGRACRRRETTSAAQRASVESKLAKVEQKLRLLNPRVGDMAAG